MNLVVVESGCWAGCWIRGCGPSHDRLFRENQRSLHIAMTLLWTGSVFCALEAYYNPLPWPLLWLQRRRSWQDEVDPARQEGTGQTIVWIIHAQGNSWLFLVVIVVVQRLGGGGHVGREESKSTGHERESKVKPKNTQALLSSTPRVTFDAKQM